MKNRYGQTALVLILLTAVALIFLAISLNWGRLAQTKSLLTVAADGAASMLASDAASYGESQKQTNLKDTNQLKGQTGTWLSLLLIVIAVIVAIFTFGSGAGLFLTFVAVASVAMATVNLVLQLVVVQPGITSMWNSMQKSQPIQQQFYEQGVSTALQSIIGDQVKVTDYLDWNMNGVFGLNAQTKQANDKVSRFAVFYTDRLRMLNQQPTPQVAFFYGQLSELMNGESCDQNTNDFSLYSSWGVVQNSACSSLNCSADPQDPACEAKIPGTVQLNDACTGSDPSNLNTYTPYCDPCCQPQYVPDSNPDNPKVLLRPSSCADDSKCINNNPYGSSYMDIYDGSFQQYSNGSSFLDQLGRDQQMSPFTTLTPNVIGSSSASPISQFPNGVFPFFWLMNKYSPQVDSIDPTVSNGVSDSQYQWCVAGSTMLGGSGTVPAIANIPGFEEINQLTLPYACTGKDCCINFIATGGSAGGTSVSSAPSLTFNLTDGPIVNLTSPGTGKYFAAGDSVTISASATDTVATISNITLYLDGSSVLMCSGSPCVSTGTATTASGSTNTQYTVYATATDSNSTTAQSSNVVIHVVEPPTVDIINIGAVTAGASVVITAKADAPATGDSVSSVIFYDGTKELGNGTWTSGDLYTYTWTAPAAGTSYQLTAVVTDALLVNRSVTSAVLAGTVPS